MNTYEVITTITITPEMVMNRLLAAIRAADMRAAKYHELEVAYEVSIATANAAHILAETEACIELEKLCREVV